MLVSSFQLKANVRFGALPAMEPAHRMRQRAWLHAVEGSSQPASDDALPTRLWETRRRRTAVPAVDNNKEYKAAGTDGIVLVVLPGSEPMPQP